ncbi:MAG TPA: DUF3857 domain-containing protein [Ferruginibacter sp.]|nr:hypothetical protein [Chitinophagaceae bacterium]HRI24896.1 DUF3857 domain-containing protein [Ferruginibacter sp.]
MKRIVTVVLMLALVQGTRAQKGLPGFGKVDKADLLLTDCDFDKGAGALVLIDYGHTYYDRGTVGFSAFKTVFERRIRIKILKESGMPYADVRIPYYTRNNEQRILKLNASTYNLDAAGKVQATEVKKSSIYAKRLDADYSSMIITFPEVKVGSIIEYSYSMESETISLNDWYFQRRIPVRYSEYKLEIPQMFRFSIQPNITDSIEDKQEVTTKSISLSEGYIETPVLTSQYIMRNLVGIKEEPFMGAVRDYLQRIEFHLMQIDYGDRTDDRRTKWADIVASLKKSESFGKQLETPVPGTASLLAEARAITDPEQRMRFVYEYLRRNLTWNDEDGIFADAGIVKTWETKTGNQADINLLLISLLNDAGLKASPVLLSTRSNGLTLTNYPNTEQFNSLMAYVTIKEGYFILDATNRIIHYKLTPEQVVNTNGFIVEGETGRWKEILSGKYHYKVTAAVQGEIDAEGNMKGNCLVNCYDYARVQRCEELASNPGKFKDDYFYKPYPSVKVEDISINNATADSLPLEQKIKFSTSLNSSGNYRYFTVNLFSDLDKNHFIAEKRFSDVDFGIQQDYNLFGNFTIPADYVFDGLPETTTFSTPDRGILFTRTVNADGNLLNIRITVEFKRNFYGADSYADFREFHKKMFEKLNEQVVIKKKTSP